jgi:hypothetical protein
MTSKKDTSESPERAKTPAKESEKDDTTKSYRHRYTHWYDPDNPYDNFKST